MKTITVVAAGVTIPSATGTITSNNTIMSDGDTVTIGTKVYTFKTALTPTEGQVLIAGSADDGLLNLIRAINHTGTPNTDYKCAAANADVTAATSVTSHAFAVTAIEAGLDGNSIATTDTASTLSWGAATLTGGEAITIVGTVVEQTATQPAQLVTIGEFPTLNSAFIRQHRLTTSNFQCLRPTVGVAMDLTSWGVIAYSVEPTLSFAPKITTQPADDSVAASSGTAEFTVVAASEFSAVTYAWYISTAAGGTTYGATAIADGSDGVDLVYSGATTATLTIDPSAATKSGFNFKCVITNAAGSTTSSAAKLTVT